MGLAPNIQKKAKFKLKKCNCCGNTFGPESFTVTKSMFYPDGALPFCNSCIENYLVENDFNWDCVDKLCQMIDIPFVPAEFEKLHDMNGDRVFPKYAEVFLDSQYDSLGWGDYFEEFKRLKKANALEDELPEINEEKRKKQKARWGKNYDDDALDYLDQLYNGLMNTQNVNGALQVDQALKLCKISYEIDLRISEGVDFDKLLSSYDKLVKVAEFTPKNAKNINDFDTAGEIIKWMEKKGFKNSFYDEQSRDIVDETIQNIQNFNQRLYINESGIGDEINHRIDQLKSAKELENYYDTNKTYDLDNYDNDGFNSLFREEDDFKVDLEKDDLNE